MSDRIAATFLVLFLTVLSAGAEAARPRGLVTPGDRLYIEGLDAYEAQNYDAAYTYFEGAALWGIKDAQFNLGVMKYHGQGMEPNLIDAYAWFAIAAERGDDVRKAQIRDECYVQLSEDDQVRAYEAAMALFEKYGDANTIGRVSHWYRKQRRNTGSRVGFEGGALLVFAKGNNGKAAPYNVVNWNAERFAGSLALPDGFVKYGELEIVEDDEAWDEEDTAGENDQDEPQRD